MNYLCSQRLYFWKEECKKQLWPSFKTEWKSNWLMIIFFFFFIFVLEISTVTTTTEKNPNTNKNKNCSHKPIYSRALEHFLHYRDQKSPLSYNWCHIPEMSLVWDSLNWSMFQCRKLRSQEAHHVVFSSPRGTTAVVPSGGRNILVVTISNSLAYTALAAQGWLLFSSEHKFYLYLKAPVLSWDEENYNSCTYICFQCN